MNQKDQGKKTSQDIANTPAKPTPKQPDPTLSDTDLNKVTGGASRGAMDGDVPKKN
jgi:hypothetical protein